MRQHKLTTEDFVKQTAISDKDMEEKMTHRRYDLHCSVCKQKIRIQVEVPVTHENWNQAFIDSGIRKVGRYDVGIVIVCGDCEA